MDYSDIYIVIPAFNEEMFIGQVLDDLIEEGFSDIIVVNDGSIDTTHEICLSKNIEVISHKINLGAGAATQTGIEYALKRGAEAIITIDGDAQHDVKDIPGLITQLDQADIVIGNRFLKPNKIPNAVRFYNWIGNLLTFLLTLKYIGDSQSGLKAISANSATKIKLRFNGYEFCTDMIRQAVQHKLKIAEVPIHVYYHKAARKKGQNFITGFITALSLIFTHHPRKG